MQRREKRNQKDNKNVITGSVQAVTSIGRGIYGGVAGVFEKPIEGVMKGGVKGFIKGTWKGLRGLVFKPVTGVVDGVSKLTEGVSNTFIEDAAKKALKAREPRMFYGRERIFKAYSEMEPMIFKFVCKKKPKKYPNFTFMDCVILKEEVPCKDGFLKPANLCLWITLERIFLIHLDLYKFVWKMRVENISEVQNENNSVNLVYKQSTKSIHGTAARIPVSDFETRVQIFTKLTILKELVEETYELA